MNAFFHALAFLTRIPVPRLSDSTADWQKSPAYFPVVGLLIGCLLWGAAWLVGHLFSPLLAAVLLVVFWIYLTGALHADGWMDLADGLGSNRPREEMMNIMKDSRVGAMGVIAAIALIQVKMAAVYELLSLKMAVSLLLPPIAARFALVCAIWFWPYISPNGMGSGMGEGLNGWKIGLNLVMTMVLAVLAGGLPFLLVLVAAYVCGFWFVRYPVKRLGGLTGDGYGALVEWTEACTLLFCILVGRWLG